MFTPRSSGFFKGKILLVTLKFSSLSFLTSLIFFISGAGFLLVFFEIVFSIFLGTIFFGVTFLSKIFLTSFFFFVSFNSLLIFEVLVLNSLGFGSGLINLANELS